MMPKTTVLILASVGVAAAFLAVMLYMSETAEAAPYQCPSGTYTATCQSLKTWCSNRDRAPSTFECGCVCGTGSCQDGNPHTLNSCTSTCSSISCSQWRYTRPPTCIGEQRCSAYTSTCSSTSCPANTADVNNNPADGCEVNLLTNPSNCGSVGNVCASGTCNSGTCNDFNVSLDPTKGLANRGDVKNSNVSLSVVAGTSSVSLSASGVPAGTAVSFSPTSCSPNCYSNMTVNTSATTPLGSSIISVTGTSGSLVRSKTYNLTVLPSSGIASCGNLVCNYPETQVSCASDCNTTATLPSPVTPGEIVTISVEFWDFRYLAGGKVRVDLSIDGATVWNAANGCSIGGVKLGPTSGSGTTAWPSGTVSEDGHFKVTALCTVPSSISAGAHTLSATPTIF